jgi:hypothetical protein
MAVRAPSDLAQPLKGDGKQAQQNHDATIAKLSSVSKAMDNLEGIQKLYSDPNLAAEFGKLFEGRPEVTVWADSGWAQY